MSPRPYQLGQRQAARDQTRSRILNATRALLVTPDGYSRFSIEMVARQASVARMTVYHQFGSKSGLLEALCDSLALTGGMERAASAFSQPEPLVALNRYIEIFEHFWDADRLVMRRLRALAILDPDFEQVVRARDEWRRKGIGVITRRIAEKQLPSLNDSIEETIDVFFTLTSFETFDTLAGTTRTLEDVVSIVQRLARGVIGLT